jgi:hypothetical protein
MKGKDAELGGASSVTSMNWSFEIVYLPEQWCNNVISQ